MSKQEQNYLLSIRNCYVHWDLKYNEGHQNSPSNEVILLAFQGALLLFPLCTVQTKAAQYLQNLCDIACCSVT